MGNTAGIYNYEVGNIVVLGLRKPALLKQLSDLLALVLVDLTTEGIYGENSHKESKVFMEKILIICYNSIVAVRTQVCLVVSLDITTQAGGLSWLRQFIGYGQ